MELLREDQNKYCADCRAKGLCVCVSNLNSYLNIFGSFLSFLFPQDQDGLRGILAYLCV